MIACDKQTCRFTWYHYQCVGLDNLTIPDGEFTLVTRRPYCPGRPKELCFTMLSLAMETMRMRLSVVKQSFFGPLGQYGCLVTRANGFVLNVTVISII